MERGLIWLSLLAIFVGLAWAGWYEYQKIQAYQRWAAAFDQAKYDIYAVLGQKDLEITWGKPAFPEPLEIQQLSLLEVVEIALWVDDRPVDLDNQPAKGLPILVLERDNGLPSVKIPFTEIAIAIQWVQYLQKVKANFEVKAVTNGELT